MKTSRLIMLAALLPGLLLVPAASSSEAGTATTLTMTLTEADGTPMVGADVSVYYYPSVITAGVPLPLMGSATSDPTGTAVFTLDTSMVPAGDLGDNGDGVNDAFNTLVVGSDPAGHLIYWHEVVTLNTTTTDSASAQVNASGQPLTGTPASQVPGATPGLSPLNLVGTSYRYVQVLAANSGVGMSTKMFYTETTSTGRQTDIEAAAENLDAGGTWSDSGGMMEQTDRTINAPWYYNGFVHHYIWASYQFQEWHQFGCNRFWCWNDYEWDPHWFSGYTTDNNPDYWRNGTKIGVVNYQPPGFNYCQGEGSCWFPLTPNNSGWLRSSGTRQTYSFELDVASFLSLRDWATYGSITSQTWWYQDGGCISPDERILWGDQIDPGHARIVQANCLDPYAYGP